MFCFLFVTLIDRKDSSMHPKQADLLIYSFILLPVKKKKQKKKTWAPKIHHWWIRDATLRPSGVGRGFPSTGRWPAGRRATGWLARSPVDQWGHLSVDQGHLLVDQWSAGCRLGGRSLWDEMFPPWPHVAEDHGWSFFISLFFRFYFSDSYQHGCFPLHVKWALSPSFQVYREFFIVFTDVFNDANREHVMFPWASLEKFCKTPFIV